MGIILLKNRIQKGKHQVVPVLALAVFPSLRKMRKSVCTTGSNVYDFLTEYWAGASVFWRGLLSQVLGIYATGEGPNDS
jgi:hypothetical protein